MATEHCTEDWNACFMDVGFFLILIKLAKYTILWLEIYEDRIVPYRC